MRTNFHYMVSESLVGLQTSPGSHGLTLGKTPPIDGVTQSSTRALALGPPAFTCGVRVRIHLVCLTPLS